MTFLTVLMALLLFSTPAVAETARVTYVTSKSFYVDAGQSAGLVPGVEVELLRGGELLGMAVVQEVTASRAICGWAKGDLIPVPGDQISFVPVTVAPESLSSPGTSTWFDRVGLHGRIGMQTLHLRDRSGFGSDFDRPDLNLRLRGRNLGGSSLGTEIDVRAAAFRQSRDGQSDTETRSRVYRLNLFGGDSAKGWGWTAGRQFAPSLAVIHLFDGARAEFARNNWTVGVLGGTQPEPDLALSRDAIEAGTWFTYRSTSSRTRWATTVAMVGTWNGGEVDREFAWLQGRWSRDGLTVRADQVLDLNRGWKKDVGESTISSTSTYLMGSWQAHRILNLNGGLDTRRRVRFLRDQNTPETEFDDSYRQGYWLGARSRPLSWLTVGMRGRTRLRSDRERADSGTLNLGFRTNWLGNLRFGTRSTMYRSELVTGWLQSGRLSAQPHPRVTIGAFGGARHETGRSNDLMDGTDPWVGADVDVTVGRRAWMSLRWESQLNGEEAFDQLWVGTGLRF
ncbi:hypothetical protein DRQ53_06460 [bacterium]|nr:MAG: hypothetical protein DRQ53_06460 [bacterium]